MREFVTVSGMRCEVEPTGTTMGQRDRGAPKANVIAPDGYVFSGGESALAIHSAADLKEIEATETLSEEDNG